MNLAICIEANMYPWNGKHWFDPSKRLRFMEYKGHVFYLAPDEVWRPYTPDTPET